MRYRIIALMVIVLAASISLATSVAVGFGLALALVLAAVSGTLGGSTVALVWLLRRSALTKYGGRW
jgi:hypothetical protein